MNHKGDGPDLRDCVIRSGVISPLISLIKSYLHFQVLTTNTVCGIYMIRMHVYLSI